MQGTISPLRAHVSVGAEQELRSYPARRTPCVACGYYLRTGEMWCPNCGGAAGPPPAPRRSPFGGLPTLAGLVLGCVGAAAARAALPGADLDTQILPYYVFLLLLGAGLSIDALLTPRKSGDRSHCRRCRDRFLPEVAHPVDPY